MLLTKTNIKEFTNEVRELAASMKAKAIPYVAESFTGEPFWVELFRLQKEARRRARELYKEYRDKPLQEVVKVFELQYMQLNPYHNRVRNPRTGKFIDWWKGKKQTLLNAKGDYTYYSSSKSIIKQIVQII